MRYKAVIFDLDGTLLDTLKDLALTGNRVLASMNLDEHPLEAYKTFVGDGMQTLVARILPENRRTETIIQKTLQLFRDDYAKNWNVHTIMYDGVEEMLISLENMQMPLSILSNKPERFTRLCVEELLTSWNFWPVMGQRSDVPKKPDPTLAFNIADKLGFAAEQILFVGDTSIDMQTAANAGMDSVGVEWGFRTRKELKSNGARYLIQHPKELLDILQL